MEEQDGKPPHREEGVLGMTDTEDMDMEQRVLSSFIEYGVALCHERALKSGWWTDPATGGRKERNVGEALMLIVSEVAEAMEGHRKNRMDDHLPQYTSLTVELGDAIIRIFDLAGGLGLPLGRAVADKLAYNATRADHKLENRVKDGGKSY